MTARLLVKQPDGVRERPPAELSDPRGMPAWLDVEHPDDVEMALIADELASTRSPSTRSTRSATW